MVLDGQSVEVMRAWLGELDNGLASGPANLPAMNTGAPLAQADGRANLVKKPLELAAEALGQGQAIPEEAQTLMAKPVVPYWVYRLVGGMSWRQQAKRWGT